MTHLPILVFVVNPQKQLSLLRTDENLKIIQKLNQTLFIQIIPFLITI